MKVEIISVVEKDCLEITTNEIMPLYRRYDSDYWCHYLGDLHGWHKYMDTEFLEDAYQRWVKNEQAEKNNK